MNTYNPNRKKRNRKKRALRKIKRILWTICAILIAFNIGYAMGKRKPKESIITYAPIIEKEEKANIPVQTAPELVKVSAPKDYTDEEVLQKLNSLVADERYEKIVSNMDDYPEPLLKNLANNPEMISFVANYKSLKTNPSKGSISQEELNEKCPLFLQWDERWGAISYGDESNIAVSGCGPSALAMVIVGLTHNQDATPDALASFAMKKGYYMSGTGTKWSLMTEGAAEYGLSSKIIDTNQTQMEQNLDKGGFLICSMGKGDFTLAGHFIVIYDYDQDGFKLNDPFCIYRSKQSWTYDKLKSQIKKIWVLKDKMA